MANNLRLLLVMCVAGFGVFVVGGPLGDQQRVLAQEPGRSSRSDGESRDERRDRYRGRFVGGDRGGEGDRGGDRSRDSRGGRSRDDERSSSSGSSSGSSNNSSSRSTPSSSSTSPGSADSKSSGGSQPSLSTSDYAKTFVKEHDKNGNHWLDGDELKDLRGKPAEADLNKDGVITVEELATRLSSTGPTASSSSPSASSSAGGGPSSSGSSESSGHRHRDGDDRSKGDSDGAQRVFTGSAGGLASTTKEGDKRRTYRFTPGSKRLPTGLPGWFTSKDANGDGQVSMSEYGRSWTERTVAEFRHIDLNDDGIITPKEAVKQPSSGG